LVYGWALVTKDGGEDVQDLQDDLVDGEEIRETAHAFIKGERVLGRMHTLMGVGEVVESVVLTKDIQDALGIDLGVEGWFVGVHVTDDDTWSRVQKGELRMFSIGGTGERHPVIAKRAGGAVLFAEAYRA